MTVRLKFRARARRPQRGMTLIEAMIALVVGLMVSGAMLAMMANTLGTGTSTIEMTRLSQELRSVMQLVSRDVRRSSYNAEAIRCFSNIDCAADGTFPAGLPGDLTINDANDCVIFEMDRDHDGDPSSDAPGGFRRATLNGIGLVQAWVGAGDTTCTSTAAGWIGVTDPSLVNVKEFRICPEIDSGDAECNGKLLDGSVDPAIPGSLSFSEVVEDDGAGNQTLQRTRKIYLRLSADMVGDAAVSKTISDVIRVRNDIIIL